MYVCYMCVCICVCEREAFKKHQTRPRPPSHSSLPSPPLTIHTHTHLLKTHTHRDIEARATAAVGKVKAAREGVKAAARLRDANAKDKALVGVREAIRDLQALEREQAKLREVLKQIAMAVAANGMAREQKRVSQRERARFDVCVCVFMCPPVCLFIRPSV